MSPISTPVSETLALVPDDVDRNGARIVVAIVEKWHDGVHSGAFRMCSEQPCHAVVWSRPGDRG